MLRAGSSSLRERLGTMVNQSNQIGLYMTIPAYLGGMGFAAFKAWRRGKSRAKVRMAQPQCPLDECQCISVRLALVCLQVDELKHGSLTVDGEMASHYLGGREFGTFVTMYIAADSN